MFLILAALLALAPRPAVAGAPAVHVSGGDSLSVWIRVDWEDPLPSFVEERLTRGIPATVGLRIELWRSRAVWFDRLLATRVREYKIIRDPWGETFSLVQPDGSSDVDSLAALRRMLSHWKVRLPVDRAWCDMDSNYRIVVTTYVRPLTAKDVNELDTWLKGELVGFHGGILGFPRGLLGIVTDLCGLGERASKGSSARFQLSTLEPDRVRVLIRGGESMGVAGTSGNQRMAPDGRSGNQRFMPGGGSGDQRMTRSGSTSRDAPPAERTVSASQ